MVKHAINAAAKIANLRKQCGGERHENESLRAENKAVKAENEALKAELKALKASPWKLLTGMVGQRLAYRYHRVRASLSAVAAKPFMWRRCGRGSEDPEAGIAFFGNDQYRYQRGGDLVYLDPWSGEEGAPAESDWTYPVVVISREDEVPEDDDSESTASSEPTKGVKELDWEEWDSHQPANHSAEETDATSLSVIGSTGDAATHGPSQKAGFSSKRMGGFRIHSKIGSRNLRRALKTIQKCIWRSTKKKLPEFFKNSGIKEGPYLVMLSQSEMMGYNSCGLHAEAWGEVCGDPAAGTDGQDGGIDCDDWDEETLDMLHRNDSMLADVIREFYFRGEGEDGWGELGYMWRVGVYYSQRADAEAHCAKLNKGYWSPPDWN